MMIQELSRVRSSVLTLFSFTNFAFTNQLTVPLPPVASTPASSHLYAFFSAVYVFSYLYIGVLNKIVSFSAITLLWTI